MAYRKRTLRKMYPTARKLAKLIGEVQSVGKRLNNLIAEIESLEGDSRALKNHRCDKTEYEIVP